MLGESKKNELKNFHVNSSSNMIFSEIIILLDEELTRKSCYANFLKLKYKVMLGEFQVSRIHVRRGLSAASS